MIDEATKQLSDKGPVAAAHAWARPRRLAGSVAIVGLLTGCTAPVAELAVIPLSTSRLSLDGPLSHDLELLEGGWWEDEDGTVCIAMQVDKPSAIDDRIRDSFSLSLILDKPPAGDAREYPGSRKTMRALWQQGAMHLRLRSYRGIVTLERESDTVFTGRLRMHCATQRFDVLQGWRRQARTLLQGTFRVEHDPAAREILEVTERGQPREADPGAEFIPG